MSVDWFKCKGGVWCELFKVDLTHSSLNDLVGVYLIWTGAGSASKVLRIGSGKLQVELLKNKKDLALQAFSHLGVCITFAEVPNGKEGNVHAYLAKTYEPSMTMQPTPSLSPLKVNLPW